MEYMYAHVSIDCVVFGFDGKELNVLLIEKEGASDLKLPGSLIFQQEDTDSAAQRVFGSAGVCPMPGRKFDRTGAGIKNRLSL
jgi:hypothetical protein